MSEFWLIEFLPCCCLRETFDEQQRPTARYINTGNTRHMFNNNEQTDPHTSNARQLQQQQFEHHQSQTYHNNRRQSAPMYDENEIVIQHL